MKAVMLYRPGSEFARVCEEFVNSFKQQTSHTIEVLDVDSKEGIQKMQAYGLYDHPVILVIQDNGQLSKSWAGSQLPLLNDVLGYLVS